MVRVFCVRHGNTFYKDEVARRVGARTDLPLVESGLEQAAKLGEYFSLHEIVFAAAYCSPLVRTIETASILLQKCSANVIAQRIEFLREIDYGPDENKTEAEVRDRIGSALDAWELDSVVPPGWEIDRPLIIRGWSQFLEQQRRDYDRKNVLVVTSNGIARFIPDVCDQGSTILPSRKMATGSFSEIEVSENARRIVRWGVRP